MVFIGTPLFSPVEDRGPVDSRCLLCAVTRSVVMRLLHIVAHAMKAQNSTCANMCTVVIISLEFSLNLNSIAAQLRWELVLHAALTTAPARNTVSQKRSSRVSLFITMKTENETADTAPSWRNTRVRGLTGPEIWKAQWMNNTKFTSTILGWYLFMDLNKNWNQGLLWPGTRTLKQDLGSLHSQL